MKNSRLLTTLDEVTVVLQATESTLEIDPFLAELARGLTNDLLIDESGVKEEAIGFLEIADSPAKLCIIQYLAHRFRWPWLKSEISQRLALSRSSRDLRAMRRYEVMLESFDDDWQDVDLFPSLIPRSGSD